MPRVATKLERRANGTWFARRRIPDDLKADYERIYRKRAEELFKTAPNVSEKEARRQWKEWSAEIDARFETIRAAKRGEGITLSKVDARRLAADWYRWFVSRNGAGNIHGQYWDECRDQIQRELLDHGTQTTDTHQIWDEVESAKEAVRPMIADIAQTAQFLAGKSVVLTASAQVTFLDQIYFDLGEALALLVRRSEGDYSPDKYAEKLPRAFQPKSGVTATELWKKFIELRKPAEGTVDRWRSTFIAIEQRFGAIPVDAILPDEAREWVNKLVTDERGAKTVRDVWLNAANTVFNWGVKEKLIHANPFRGIHVTVPKDKRNRETKAFTDSELRLVLSAAMQFESPKTPSEAAKRFVPWIAAYTGARGGEITQLRGSDVFKQSGIYAVRITPEAGTVKTGEARVVPLHEHLVEQGFVKFAQGHGQQPLFYNPDKSGKAVDPTNPRKPRWRGAREDVAEFVRKHIADPEVKPLHAFRHTFKQRADRAGISEKVNDAITGHAQASVARDYGKPTLVDMANELKKFPRYAIGNDPASSRASKKTQPSR